MKNAVVIFSVLFVLNHSMSAQRCEQIKSIDQILTSNCDSNSRLSVEVDGLRFVNSIIDVPLGNHAKQIIVEAICRDQETYDGSTCPTSIVYTVDGEEISISRMPLNYCSSWVPFDYLREGFFYVYRLIENKPVTSIQYNPPTSVTDREGMRGLTTWIIKEDASNANSPNGLNFDYFLFRVEEKCADVTIAPSELPRDLTIHIPVSEIDYNITRFTRYRAEAFDLNGNVVASLPNQLFNGSNIAQEIRLDKLLFNNVPGSATKIKICIESPYDSEAIGPSFMVGSVMITSNEVCDVPSPCVDDTQFPTKYSGCVDNVATFENGTYVLKNQFASIYDCSSCADYTNLENCSPVTGLENLSANEALWAATKTAEYFITKHEIDLPHINIIVNCSNEPNEAVYKKGYNTIVLGKGDNDTRTSMSSLDIVAHEMVHHFIENIFNGEFGLFGETGALQESFADIFAEVIENHVTGTNDWVIGKEVTKDGKGIRTLKDPYSFSHPDTYKDLFWVDQITCYNTVDNCGIHTNNGVQNYWFYILSEGDSGTNYNNLRYNSPGIDMDKAAEITFRNLTTYLNPNSTYVNAKIGARKAAIDLFGSHTPEVEETIIAWDVVGCIDSAFDDVNHIEFSISNYDDTVIDNRTIQIEFDLHIDSLCQDISADGLNIFLAKNGIFENIEIGEIYSPLLKHKVEVTHFNNCISIELTSSQLQTINRKLNKKISSGQALFRVISCVPEEDVPIDTASISRMEISGFSFTEIDSIKFENQSLDFPNPFRDDINVDNPKFLPAMFSIKHHSCRYLGSIDISIFQDVGKAPFTYSICNPLKGFIKQAEFIDRNHTIYSLENGIYQLNIQDQSGNSGQFDLVVKFNDTVGDNCIGESCPYYLSFTSKYFSDGDYCAEKEIEIKGYIDGSKDVNFSINNHTP